MNVSDRGLSSLKLFLVFPYLIPPVGAYIAQIDFKITWAFAFMDVGTDISG